MHGDKIYYREVRSMSGILQAPFQYLKLNFKSLFLALLLFSGPFLFIAAIIAGYLVGTTEAFKNIFYYSDKLEENELGFFWFALVVYALGVGIHNMLVNKHIIENEKNTVSINIQLLRNNFSEQLQHSFMNFAAAVFVLYLIRELADFLTGGNSVQFPHDPGFYNIMNFILEVLLMALPFLIIVPVVSYLTLASLFICQRDKMNLINAVAKVWSYTRDNLKKVWLTSLVSLLVYYACTAILSLAVVLIVTIPVVISEGKIPDFTYFWGNEIGVFSSVLNIVLYYGVGVFFHISLIFLYCAVEEEKEGENLKSLIENI